MDHPTAWPMQAPAMTSDTQCRSATIMPVPIPKAMGYATSGTAMESEKAESAAATAIVEDACPDGQAYRPEKPNGTNSVAYSG